MKIKTEDLVGPALDWAVAKCEGVNERHVLSLPDLSWQTCGPIIERERISIRQWTNVPLVHAYMPYDDAPWASDGTSLLIAAMRCYVASKLGDEVDVPEELTCSPAPKNV